MTHIQEVQIALDYIDMNLHDEMTLDEISKVVGFSKFYFHKCALSRMMMIFLCAISASAVVVGKAGIRRPIQFQYHLTYQQN